MTTDVAATNAVPLPREEQASVAVTRVKRNRRRIRWGANIVAIVFAIVWIFPVYWMLNTAFKPRDEVMSATPRFWPGHIDVGNFVSALAQPAFLQDLRNSLLCVFGTLIIAILLGMFASAALTRFRYRGRKVILVVILAVQMLPSTALLIPQFLVFNRIGLTGTYIGLILAYVASVLPFSIWVMRGFFLAIPVELEEAAAIDGAGPWRILFSVLFPLVTPGIIASSIFAFIAAWNDYLTAYVFMSDSSMYTLPLWLQSFTTPNGGTDYGAQMAASVVFSLPVVVFFLIIQRNLVSGMSAGAVKG
ncbi:MAG TPA: carbohydrate ABC transporter permease [Gryllotalpicola sp.]